MLLHFSVRHRVVGLIRKSVCNIESHTMHCCCGPSTNFTCPNSTTTCSDGYDTSGGDRKITWKCVAEKSTNHIPSNEVISVNMNHSIAIKFFIQIKKWHYDIHRDKLLIQNPNRPRFLGRMDAGSQMQERVNAGSGLELILYLEAETQNKGNFRSWYFI